MFLQQLTLKKQSIKSCIAMILVMCLLYTFLPSVSEAHHKTQTITTMTVTTTVTYGWQDSGEKNEAGEPVMVYVELTRTTTTSISTTTSVIQHPPISWGTILTGGAAFITAVVLIFRKPATP